MHRLYFLVSASILVAVAGIQNIPAIKITNDTAINYPGLTALVPLVVNQDLIISFDYPTKEVLVFKRDAEYNYHVVSSRIITANNPLPVISSFGKWIATATLGLNVEFFQLNLDGSIQQQAYYIDSVSTGWLFPDETFVALDVDAIRTYSFNGTGWSLLRSDTPEKSNALILNNDISSWMKVGPTYFTGFNTNSTFVYERHENLSWSLVSVIETETITTSQFRVVLYNSNDTIIVSTVLSESTPTVLAKIYTKTVNGEWNMTQQIMASDADINSGYVPYTATMVDSDSFVYSAIANDLDVVKNISGSLLWFERTAPGTWNYTRKVRTSMPNSVLGFGIAPIDNTVLTFECGFNTLAPCYLTRAEVCLLEPTNVTCHDHVSNSCDASINLTDLYTTNTPSRCGAVQAEISDSQTTAAGVELGLRFTRDGVADVTCSATMLCDTTQPFNAPPISISQPQDQPITTSQPVAQPHRSRVSDGARDPVTKIVVTFSVMALLLM